MDRYQGQQNDYIILSLVRTKHVGHLRDVRRLVVAMSRARLGLYVLARVPLFQGCTELEPTFKLARPHTHTHMYHIHTCTPICTHMYTHVHTCTHMYTYMHTQAQKNMVILIYILFLSSSCRGHWNSILSLESYALHLVQYELPTHYKIHTHSHMTPHTLTHDTTCTHT